MPISDTWGCGWDCLSFSVPEKSTVFVINIKNDTNNYISNTKLNVEHSGYGHFAFISMFDKEYQHFGSAFTANFVIHDILTCLSRQVINMFGNVIPIHKVYTKLATAQCIHTYQEERTSSNDACYSLSFPPHCLVALIQNYSRWYDNSLSGIISAYCQIIKICQNKGRLRKTDT